MEQSETTSSAYEALVPHQPSRNFLALKQYDHSWSQLTGVNGETLYVVTHYRLTI